MNNRFRCTEGCCVSDEDETLPDFTRRSLIAHGLAKPNEELVFVDNDPSNGSCHFCGKVAELRMGMCFDCFKNGTPRERANSDRVAELLSRAEDGK
jgi:hypothetical protein